MLSTRLRSHGWILLPAMLLLGWAPQVAGAPAEGEPPIRVVLFVVPASSAADLPAAQVYRELQDTAQKSNSLSFIDPDLVLGGGEGSKASFEKARSLLEDAKKAYDNLELAAAIKMLKQAAAEMEAHLGDLVDPELYSDILIYQGASLVLLGEQEQGKRVFRKLLIFNRKAELNPMVFPPALAAVFKGVASDVQKSGNGALEIRPKPLGTEVWVDGTFKRIGPVRVSKLVEGEHFLRLVRRGHFPFGVKQEVLENGEEVIDHELKPLPEYDRLNRLMVQMISDASQTEYTDAVDETLRWMNVDRMFVIRVDGTGKAITLKGAYYDRVSRRCLKSKVVNVDPTDKSFKERLDLFFSSLYVDLASGPLVSNDTGSGGSAGDSSDTSGNTDRGGRKWWKTWWFWTAVGVAVLGGTGLALGLTLGGGGTPSKGNVIFYY